MGPQHFRHSFLHLHRGAGKHRPRRGDRTQDLSRGREARALFCIVSSYLSALQNKLPDLFLESCTYLWSILGLCFIILNSIKCELGRPLIKCISLDKLERLLSHFPLCMLWIYYCTLPRESQAGECIRKGDDAPSRGELIIMCMLHLCHRTLPPMCLHSKQALTHL